MGGGGGGVTQCQIQGYTFYGMNILFYITFNIPKMVVYIKDLYHILYNLVINYHVICTIYGRHLPSLLLNQVNYLNIKTFDDLQM